MKDLAWTESLAAPRSVAAAHDLAIAVIEDPGVVEIRAARDDAPAREALGEALGGPLPGAIWSTSWVTAGRAIRVGPDRWRLILPREQVSPLLARLDGVQDLPIALSDLTGACAALRVVGPAAIEILAKVCPLDLRPVEAGAARGSTLAGVGVLLIREEESIPSWLVLAPRSMAEHVAHALLEAARPPGRVHLFAPAPPPPV